MKLDLFSISDAEFEELCCDMMSVKFCEDTKHGRRGRDFGIDGVVAKNGVRIYMQAKHYKTDGYSALRSVVKKEEVEKSKKLINCTRYILMTSCELSVPQKDEILKLYGGIITSINDIWSGEDIRATLAKPEYQWVAMDLILDLVLKPSIRILYSGILTKMLKLRMQGLRISKSG